jgi:hypothetical protein
MKLNNKRQLRNTRALPKQTPPSHLDPFQPALRTQGLYAAHREVLLIDCEAEGLRERALKHPIN